MNERKEIKMKVDVVDMQDAAFAKWVMMRLNGHSDVVIQLFGGMDDGCRVMIQRITGSVAAGQMEVLRIWGHGAPGLQAVTAGRCDGVDRYNYIAGNYLSRDMLICIEDEVKFLGSYFADYARIELKGCQVAVGDKGKAFVSLLALMTNCTVHAALTDQYWNEMTQLGPGVGWSGLVSEFLPTGIENGFAYRYPL